MLPNFKLSSVGNCALPQMYVAVLVRKSQRFDACILELVFES